MYTDDEIYLQLRGDSGLADMFFDVAPSVNGQRYWLYGTIIPTEYEQYREHLQYHRHAGVVQPAIAVAKGTK